RRVVLPARSASLFASLQGSCKAGRLTVPSCRWRLTLRKTSHAASLGALTSAISRIVRNGFRLLSARPHSPPRPFGRFSPSDRPTHIFAKQNGCQPRFGQVRTAYAGSALQVRCTLRQSTAKT